MTVEAEETSDHPGRPGDVSGAVINALMGMVHARNGDIGVAQVLALAGEDRSFSTLRDTSARSSLAETVALFNAAALVTGDGAVGLHVGERLLASSDSTDFVDRLVTLGSPDAALKHVSALTERFETRSTAVPLEVASDHALIRVSPRTTESRHAHLCEMTRGLLSQVPTLYGLGPALISETECSARGGRFCLYALSWDDPSSLVAAPPESAETEPTLTHLSEGDVASTAESSFADDPSVVENRPVGEDPSVVEDAPSLVEDRSEISRASQTIDELQSELRRMGVLLEGVFATATELLSDDVDALLAEIAARADAVVSSHHYLLLVRVRPGTPIQLHHRGLLADEAQILAAELWRENPDDDGGARIIVDIASSRRLYGRLVEFLPPGATHTGEEARALRMYAEYAATALDIFGLLTEARQSDATARTLLSFSEALSQVSNPADLVQLLADTAPAVTGCNQSTVFLWDRERGQLVRRAWTDGTALPDASMDAVVPLRPPDRAGMTVGDGDRSGIGANQDDSGPVAPGSPAAEAGTDWRDPEDDGLLAVRTDSPVVDGMLRRREVMVLDGSTEDISLRDLLDRAGLAASVVAPLFAKRAFLGVVAANFGPEDPIASIRDPDLHERLTGLADQAATALQNLELLEKVSHLAWHDALTGLPNRRLFEDRVEQELVRSRRVGEPVCMFFVDIDHFKMVNDTLGHAAGDELIRQVSQRLVDTVRRQDTVARVGGDEFAILLPGLSDQLSIDQLAQRSLEVLSTPFMVFEKQVDTSASIGIAMAPDHGDSYDELLSRADEAMYRVKGRGRNGFQMYSGPMVNSGEERLAIDERTLQADLIHALDHDEFFVLYQPYIDLRTAEVVGVEALVRWNHPTLGVLEPSSFISMAERSDVIVTLDAWVLQQTCQQARIWLDHGLRPLHLSVNLASRDLSSPALFDTIDRTLEETAIDPSLLELEITERVVLDRMGPAKENIERLRRLGVRFTIDDFGTGNSSLSRIGSFPVSTLKIDQSFVQVLGPEGESNSLVSAIISMADRLGLACVAEGVETSQQSRVLFQRGCTTAQGYFFSPPLAADDVEQMMAGISVPDGPSDVEDSAG